MENKEIIVAKEYISKYKYIVLNEFLFHMKMNYLLSYTNQRAVSLLKNLGLKRKRIAFEVYHGGKQSRNEFINEQGINKEKPIITRLNNNKSIVSFVANNSLQFIRENFDKMDLAESIINFNMYDSKDGYILLFDNKSLKKVLEKIKDYFTYDNKSLIQVSTAIRHMSEVSYIRENTYTETAIHAIDKKFYKYTFK
jgi:hypothetical protein